MLPLKKECWPRLSFLGCGLSWLSLILQPLMRRTRRELPPVTRESKQQTHPSTKLWRTLQLENQTARLRQRPRYHWKLSAICGSSNTLLISHTHASRVPSCPLSPTCCLCWYHIIIITAGHKWHAHTRTRTHSPTDSICRRRAGRVLLVSVLNY